MSKLHNDLANCIRFLSIDAVQKANSGHPGMPMGMADVATVLFKNFLRFNPKNPNWLNRDRFVLSAGHGSMLLYSLLYLTGYKSISLNSIKKFRQLNSICAGHPEYHPKTGIETTHHHFYDEDTHELIDCDQNDIDTINIKKNITGKKINSVEVLIKVASDNQNQN